MGIQGLLPQLRSITQRRNITAYRGQRVAVDGYCLLHRGSYTCAREIVEGEPADKCAPPFSDRTWPLVRSSLCARAQL